MSERTHSLTADRAAMVIRSVVLAAGLSVILIVAYDIVIPVPSGLSHWWTPLLIASVGGLAVLLAWPAQRAETRARTVNGGALVLGAVSLVLGIGLVLLTSYGLILQISEERVSSQTLIFRMTRPSSLTFLLKYAGAVAVPGCPWTVDRSPSWPRDSARLGGGGGRPLLDRRTRPRRPDRRGSCGRDNLPMDHMGSLKW